MSPFDFIPPSDDGSPREARNLSAANMLLNKQASRIQRTLASLIVGQGVFEQARSQVNSWKSNRSFTVSVGEDDIIFYPLQEWLFDQMPNEKKKSIKAQTIRGRRVSRRSGLELSSTNDTEKAKLGLFYDGDREQTITVEGHKVKVQVSKDAPTAKLQSSESMSFVTNVRIIFTTYTTAARDAVIRMLDALAQTESKQPPRFFLSSKWGGWNARNANRPRPMGSVVLKEGVKETLLNDLEVFFSREEQYSIWGVPWHRGYLFHGVPGTGKTSLAAAVASHYSLDIHYLSLSALDNDAALIECLQNVNDRSILVLEDVDILHAARQRTDDEPGVTMQGLLNGLDGFITPHGLITIMTTNNITVLDDALIRPGRIDHRVEIGYVDDEQLRRLCDVFLGWVPDDLPPVKKDLVPAAIVNVFKEYYGDSGRICQELYRLVEEGSERDLLLS